VDKQKQISATRNFCGIKEDVIILINQLRAILYPNIFGTAGAKGVTKSSLEMNAEATFKEIIPFFIQDEQEQEHVLTELEQALPEIHETLNTDVQAAYEGDPAAKSYDEIMLSYPSFEALTIFRIAHKLYQLDVPILPRMMTEYAHSITGIDIHPGAKVGHSFFIDHGTGVVIGETATIGHNVKIYQGVTIGAKSFKTDEDGNIIKGRKRHPDIGNNVVIYAGATILGGDTKIGDNTVIGGNVWLTKSIGENQSVIAANNEISQKGMED
jgi:serine O-acetyltransferase